MPPFRPRDLARLLLAIAVPFGAANAAAEEAPAFAGRSAFELHNGPNEIDLDADGTKDEVFVAWRENMGAHGYDAIAFYRHDAGEKPSWDLVPFDKGSSDMFRTREGADCSLADLAVLPAKDGKGPVTVVVAQRELDKTLADAEAVRFEVFELVRNDERIPGWPLYFFRRQRTLMARERYCDVREAMTKELGIENIKKRAH